MKWLRLRPGFVLLMAVIVLLDGLELAAMMALAALLHELGHLSAIALCGGRLRGFELGESGAEIIFEGSMSYGRELITALMGPMASLLATAAFVGLYSVTQRPAFAVLTGLDLLYCVFNLVPASPMDGGRALYAVAALLFGLSAADRCRRVVDGVCVAALFGLGVYAFIKTGGNVTLLICSILLLDSCCKNSGIDVKLPKTNFDRRGSHDA